MYTGNRLSIALGVVGPEAVTGDDDLSRKQLIRAGEAMVGEELAIVLNRAGTKQPICTLTAVERKRADQAARDEARAREDPNYHKRTHACGIAHAITDPQTATRVLTRMARRGRFNLGVEPRASRVAIVDLDTAAQVKQFWLRCGVDRPALTVRSPGQKDKTGEWVHRDGGHIWFDLPDGVKLPAEEGIYRHPDGWTVVWGEHQVLVPPSVRAEGSYVLVGSTHALPQWLRDLIITETAAKIERREESRRRRAHSGPTKIDEWSTTAVWADLLVPDGWTDTGLIDNCGCPIWTAPGDHGSPKSATAHEAGCAKYVCERGHGPLHVWTDNPGPALSDAIDTFKSRTLTKAQVATYTVGGGDMRQTLVEMGVPDTTGPTVLPKGAFSTWDDDTGADDQDEDASPDEDEPEVIKRTEDVDYGERMIRQEMHRELRRRAALERIAAMDAPPLRFLVGPEFLAAARPQPLVPHMLYRDSLARMFGDPGCGKSFLALDIALSIVLGRFWGGTRMKAEPVVYVMAEGQAVNGDRAQAWLSKHGVDPEALRERLYVVPDAVMMTETAAAPFIRKVAEIKPVLVILDTKNAMMVGEENSATDFAALRRVMDQVRKASDCCVLLVDHTGYEGTRARGSSAATAGMDTEVRVTKNDDEKPSMITAEVTRDKASEIGTTWAWRLVPETPAAVLVKADVPERRADAPDWLTDNSRLPDAIVDYEGQGAKAVESLARYMRLSTRLATGEQDLVGRNLADARADLKGVFDRDTVGRAWSAIKSMGFLKSVYADPTETQLKRGPHVWRVPQ
ncbi:MAG: AAA family ATPase [Pseudonocardiaceae bacterium]